MLREMLDFNEKNRKNFCDLLQKYFKISVDDLQQKSSINLESFKESIA